VLGPIEWGTMGYSLLVFIVLFLLLRKFAFGHVMRLMVERQNRIEADIKKAENNRIEAEKLFADQQAALEQARKDAQKILDNARVTSEKQAAEIMELARQEGEQFKKVARAEMEREKEKAVEALRTQVGQLSVLLATKVIEKELDAAQQEKLIADYLKEVGTDR